MESKPRRGGIYTLFTHTPLQVVLLSGVPDVEMALD